MKSFTVVPCYKTLTARYNAPTFQVEANDSKEAGSLAKSSALGRFENWSFHVIETGKIQRNFKSRENKLNKKDPKSKSQLGKLITGHSDSRPVRRGLRRLSINKAGSDKSNKVAGAIKMW